MQKLFLLFGRSCLILSLLLTVACDRFPSNPDLDDPRDALYVLIEAHALKQLWIYNYFETFSNGYEEGQLFVYEPTIAELNILYTELEDLMLRYDDVLTAAQTITDSLGLTPSPLSKTSGIFGSLFSFFSEGAEAGERHRDRILLIVSNMSPEERSDLFHNQLRSKWQREFFDADDFWTRLQNGDLNDRTGSIYNDFYDNSDLNNRFVSLADDRKLSPGNIFVKEGASLVEKGVDVVLETGKIVTPLGGGADIVEEGRKWWEKAEKAVDDPEGLIKDEIKERVAGKLAGMVDIDGAVNAVGLGEKTANAVKILSDISFGTDDTQELYENAIDWGIAKITSPDKSITPEVIVAENKSGGSSFPDLIFGVGNYVNNAGEMLMALPGGNWNITAVDKTGKSDTAPLVSITPQAETAVSYVANDPAPDSLDTVFDQMNNIEVFLMFGPSEYIIITLRPSSNVFFPASFSGKTFSADYFYWDDVYEWEHDLALDGHITLVSYDLLGVTLTARNVTKKYYSDDPDIVFREIVEEISAEDIPLSQISSSGTYINYQFDISSYYTPDLISQLPSLVTFSYRETYFDKDGVITSDETITNFIESNDNRIRIFISKISQ